MTQPSSLEPIDGEVLPRPEPVLDAGKLAGLISAVVVALVGVVLLVVAGNVLGNVDALGNALNGVGLAIAAVVAYVAPVWQARKARAKVTPLADPRTVDGTALVADRAEPYVVVPQVDGQADHAAPE